MFTYYRYVDKFHVLPLTWEDLFEYIRYNDTETEISNCLKRNAEEGK